MMACPRCNAPDPRVLEVDMVAMRARLGCRLCTATWYEAIHPAPERRVQN